jgi:rhodanese-related sulfurtransferase
MIKGILSNNAYILLNELPNSLIIDVRTQKEWDDVGVPNLKNIIFVTYKIDEELDFIKIINDKIKDKDANIFLICRSGVRSLKASNLLEKNGYTYCYNIEDGFEGSYQGLGWIKNNLPILNK